MGDWVIDLSEVDASAVALCGGKAASLGALMRIEGVRVPPGFCVTTDAFGDVLGGAPDAGELVAQLGRLGPEDQEAIAALSTSVREAVASAAVPDGLAGAIAAAVTRFGSDVRWAVRSSATAEDLPTASFAGQQDSFLDVPGDQVLAHVRRCWASLFTERAVSYRLRGGWGTAPVAMAVVVQQMAPADAAGVMFTADPVNGDRRVVAIEAVRGLGEALVSGRTTPDTFTVRDGGVDARACAAGRPVLCDEEAVALAALGRRIEAALGAPQDTEWCRAGGEFSVVQSRPITTLFPIPPAPGSGVHVYVSVGHQQMMTDAMRPLGLSVWQLATARPMAEAGGRLFVDITRDLKSEAGRRRMLMLGRSDPLIGDALQTLVDRVGFLPEPVDDDEPSRHAWLEPTPIPTDPALVTGLITSAEASIAEAARRIAGLTGLELLDFILTDIQELRRVLFAPDSMPVIMAGHEATQWLNEKLAEWLGETNAADVLSQSVPHNVTSEMGLALLDVADVVRQHPEVVAALAGMRGGESLHAVDGVAGGSAARDAIEAFLQRYGMRGVGEIDITRPRFADRPTMLVPTILSAVRSFVPGEAARRFAAGEAAATAKRDELLARLRELPDGEAKAAETERMIARLRTFAGYREFPKYGKVCREYLYRRALLAEAARLVDAGVLEAVDDIYYLRFQELYEVVRTGSADAELISLRREEFRAFEQLTPPRVITSDGEIVSGRYRRDDVPDGALPGLAVSAGTFEGRARVVLDVADADLEPGDILVTPYTDPSWTPVFVAIGGLVCEVGGLMTHGAVIAREYGLPAVVGVERATALIADGQRIRVHGTDGYVELL